jgi:hypothetical protein
LLGAPGNSRPADEAVVVDPDATRDEIPLDPDETLLEIVIPKKTD